MDDKALPGRFEGINGTARTDKLLSLQEEDIPHRVEAARASRQFVIPLGRRNPRHLGRARDEPAARRLGS